MNVSQKQKAAFSKKISAVNAERLQLNSGQGLKLRGCLLELRKIIGIYNTEVNNALEEAWETLIIFQNPTNYTDADKANEFNISSRVFVMQMETFLSDLID